MKPSTRLLIHSLAFALNVLAGFLGALTRNYLIVVVSLIMIYVSLHQILNLGNELDSFYRAYSEANSEEEEDK